MESYTPRSLIAGRVQAGRGQDLRTAAAAAAAVLGADAVAVIHSRAEGEVWFLAAPAADLASHGGSTSPLSAALPGAGGHEGDGAYAIDLAGGLQAVVVRRGKDFHSFVGTPAMAKRFVALEGTKASHPCSGAGMAWQFPAAERGRREARLSAALTASGIIVALTAAGTWLWAARSVSHLDELRAGLRQEHLAALAAAVHSLEPQAYPKALANLNKAVEQAIKENGSLVHFEHKEGRATWTLNVDSGVVTGGSN